MLFGLGGKDSLGLAELTPGDREMLADVPGLDALLDEFDGGETDVLAVLFGLGVH
jgi:hypothetical protein